MHDSSIKPVVLAGLAACALSFSTPAATAGAVRFDRDCAPVLTGFDRILYEKAREGTGVLRTYLDIRRGFLQRDIYDTAVWAETASEDHKRCVGDQAVATNRPLASRKR